MTLSFNNYPTYDGVPYAAMQMRIMKLDSILRRKGRLSDVTYDRDILEEIIDRVEMRRVYFHIFHAPMEMGELNESALYCFWILKLHPFKSDKRKSDSLNTLAALTILCAGIDYLVETEKRVSYLNQEIIERLYYAFRYQDLSKEAIMALASSLLSPKPKT